MQRRKTKLLDTENTEVTVWIWLLSVYSVSSVSHPLSSLPLRFASSRLCVKNCSIFMTKIDYPQLDVIAVGAHPDDVEIACGGTLAKLAKQGYKIGIIDLTDGEPTPGSSGPEQRKAEAKAAADAIGAQVRVILDLPNRRLFDS